MSSMNDPIILNISDFMYQDVWLALLSTIVPVLAPPPGSVRVLKSLYFSAAEVARLFSEK